MNRKKTKTEGRKTTPGQKLSGVKKSKPGEQSKRRPGRKLTGRLKEEDERQVIIAPTTRGGPDVIVTER